MRRQVGRYAGWGFVVGLMLGGVLWGSQMRRYRRELFSASAVRRMAALGYLSSSRGPDATRLLREYVRWETAPRLRRKGERLLRRLERAAGDEV